MIASLVSLLKIGTIFANLNILGNIPDVKDLLIKWERGIETVSLISFRMFVGMLLGPVLLLLFRVIITSLTSSGVVADIKKESGFGFFR